MGRSYGFAVDRYLYQAPVGYYANRGLWDMAPGYENDREPDLNRPITAECLFCHSSGAGVLPGTLNRVADLSALRGIACERCHGDATAHLSHPEAGNIVKPGELPFAERDSVCEQCHLSGAVRIPLPGRNIGDFRPGQRLSTYLAVFVVKDHAPGIRVAGHAEALAASRCRRASGQQLWCGSCHDPHSTRTAWRDVCLGCHAPRACPKVTAKNQFSADCVACHMPKARAYDGGHTVFTDHSIPRRANPAGKRTEPTALADYFPRTDSDPFADRNLGIAWAQLAEDYGDPRLFDEAWPLLRAAAGRRPRDPLLYAKIGNALGAASKTREAEEAYRLSLEQSPEQVEVLQRLAALLERDGKNAEAASLRKRAAGILPRIH
jgi:hypothetical protein